MEELMKTKIFKVTVERLILNGGQTLYMVGWSLLIGTIIGMIAEKADWRRTGRYM